MVVHGETQAANRVVYNDIRPYTNGAHYYIAAAWAEENISRVPKSYIVGDGSTTRANMVYYRNADLNSNTKYGIFIRIDISGNVVAYIVIATLALDRHNI